MTIRLLFSIIGLCLLFSCSGTEELEQIEGEFTDSLQTIVDTSDIMYNVDTNQYISKDKEKEEQKKEIIKKYGEQWDFCDCVRKNDSIQKAIEKGNDNTDYDKLFERMDVVETKCVEMLAAPNTTPEERQKHQERVKKCLKAKK
jgi:hypothetical protein